MYSRSREGAWIEIVANNFTQKIYCVAPVRERGLKLTMVLVLVLLIVVAPVRERGLKFPRWSGFGHTVSRSREGAWIEMSRPGMSLNTPLSRSREGAWIEM